MIDGKKLFFELNSKLKDPPIENIIAQCMLVDHKVRITSAQLLDMLCAL